MILVIFVTLSLTSITVDAIDNTRWLHENNENTNLNFGGIAIRTILKEIIHNKANIPFPNITTECMTIGKRLILPIWNISSTSGKINALLKSPIGKMIDAFGKLPERVLIGNTQFLGAYDECSELVDTKYCISTATFLEKIDIRYGSCFPKQCTPNDVNEMLSMLNVYNKTKKIITFSNTTLCDKATDYSTGVVSTICIMIIILSLCVVGTLTELVLPCVMASKLRSIELLYENQDIENQPSEASDFSKCNTITTIEVEKSQVVDHQSQSATMDKDTSLRLPSANVIEAKSHGNGLANHLTAFSLVKNTRAILSTHVAEGSITSINGIRVISLTWVILGHIYIVTLMGGQPDNILNMTKVVRRFSFLAINNAYVSVDTFFLLSGLLVSFLTLKRIAKKGMGCVDISVFYLHRYIRLTPSLGLAILFYTNILPIILSGPKSVLLSQTDTLPKQCYDYWWSTMFYFNNFYPESTVNVCLGWTWYLANDMQFYILSPPILILMVAIEKRYKRRHKGIILNFILITSLCLVSIVITGVITGVYDIPTLTSSIIIPGNPRLKQAGMIMDKIYAKPYCRVTPYLVGTFLGYLFSKNITLSGSSGKKISVIGWVLAIVVGLAVVYGPWKVFKVNGSFFTDTENVIYAACHRFAWGVAVAWVIYACHNNIGGLVNEFLSWKVWIPLSRLTYGAYLLHFIVLLYFLNSKDVPNHYQDNTMVFDFISITVMSYASAFVLAVCVEYPIFTLEKKILKR